MSEQLEEAPKELTAENLRVRINEGLAAIGAEEREIEFNRLRIETIIAALTDDLQQLNEPRRRLRDAYVDGVVEDFLALIKMGALKGKTIKLPNGTVSVRKGAPSLTVTDEKRLMQRLRRLRLLNRTTQVKRSIVKSKIKELPADLLARLAPLAFLETTTRVAVKPDSMQTELDRELDPRQRIIADAEPTESS